MAYAADPRGDAFIDALPDWQQAICHQVRELVHEPGGPEMVETIKRTRQPYFVLHGNVCARSFPSSEADGPWTIMLDSDHRDSRRKEPYPCLHSRWTN